MKKRFWAILFLCIGFNSLAMATPAQILIIRHAEKQPKSDFLSLKGRERAAALGPYLTGVSDFIEFGPIAAIYATNISKEDQSYRTQETVTPLSVILELPILHPYIDKEFSSLAKEILGKEDYQSKTVLVCWNHVYIPDLTKALGVTQTIPKWEDTVYDQVWMLRYDKEQTPKLHIIQQALMFGDSPINIRSMP